MWIRDNHRDGRDLLFLSSLLKVCWCPMTVFSFRRMTLVWRCPPPRQTGSRSWEERELPPQVCHPEISNMRVLCSIPTFSLPIPPSYLFKRCLMVSQSASWPEFFGVKLPDKFGISLSKSRIFGVSICVIRCLMVSQSASWPNFFQGKITRKNSGFW